jgi:hypothetical protein
MKTALKAFCLGAVFTTVIGACSGNGSGSGADSSKVDSSTSVKTSIDTTIKTDTAKADSGMLVADTPKVKMDTMSKTVTKKTVVKKTTVKKP